MAKVESKTISWEASPSQDVTAYRVRVKQDDGTGFSYSASYLETPDTRVVAPDDFPDGTFSAEGDYLLGISAVDDRGNESDIQELVHPFDVIPPDPPTGVSVS